MSPGRDSIDTPHVAVGRIEHLTAEEHQWLSSIASRKIPTSGLYCFAIHAGRPAVRQPDAHPQIKALSEKALATLRDGRTDPAARDPADRRQKQYRLTEKSMDLAPVLLELLLWGAKHEPSGAPARAIASLARRRAAVLQETRRRWRERDPRPLLPWLSGKGEGV